MLKLNLPSKIEKERLTFTEDNFAYNIHNKDKQFLGQIKKLRVGRFMHWCLLPAPIKELGDLWLSPGCQDEIREVIKFLYAEERRKVI